MHIIMDVMKGMACILAGQVPFSALDFEKNNNGNRFGNFTLQAKTVGTKTLYIASGPGAPWVLSPANLNVATSRLSYALPSAWSASAIHKAFTKPSALKAHDWALLAGPLFNQSIMGLLPAKYEELFMDLSQHLHDITRKTVSDP